MDEGKKAWIDKSIIPHIRASAPDIDLDPIIAFFEARPEHWEHRTRFLETYIRAMRHVKPEKSWQIGETGSLSGVSAFFKHDGFRVRDVKGDFRYAIDCPDSTFDLLISLEVFEHIKDQDPKTFDEMVNFNFGGTDAFIGEMWRIIKPGGCLLLSTPNACSLINLQRLLSYEPPMMFWPHVKEYSPAELIRRFEKRGFALRHWETLYGLFNLEPPQRAVLLERLFTARGASAENRGDIALYLFDRPVEVLPSTGSTPIQAA
ncbi:MAG TPA: methyltransferase domain-containing protein [Caulobacteraceae bacterium]|nr:methyltransferase domain-containing protein [Caulobacteraceae bacterium]